MNRFGTATACSPATTGRSNLVPGRQQFGLAILFRVITLVAAALGWLEIVRHAPPAFVLLNVLVVGLILAMVVALRRHGPRKQKLTVAAWFVSGVIASALYSACLAIGIQQSPRPLGPIGWLVVLLPISPIAILLLRAWTWSAHDQALFHQE
jgi:hypothetical protein